MYDNFYCLKVRKLLTDYRVTQLHGVKGIGK